jgi:5'-nucleotidase
MDRRKFISTGAKAVLGMGLGLTSLPSVGKSNDDLCLLYTNDWHSRIDPFPMDGGSFQGLGGAAKRAAMINKIRSTNNNVLLLDAGDVFQGTPYFNVFKGELEFKLMSEMGYDAITLGNHDFDAGLEGLKKQLPHAKFEILCANYDFSNTILKGHFKNHLVVERGPYRIGIVGVGIELNQLVPAKHYGNTMYSDPIAAANKEAKILKSRKNCDLVICLSHLGYSYANDKVSDIQLAKNSEHIDIILGGHTHTFLENPVEIKNKIGNNIKICQTGWAGINLGRIDFKADTILASAKPHSTMLKIC